MKQSGSRRKSNFPRPGGAQDRHPLYSFFSLLNPYVALVCDEGRFKSALHDFNTAKKEYETLPFAPGEEAMWNAFKEKTLKKYIDMNFEMIRLSGTNNPADAKQRDNLWYKDFQELRQAAKAELDKLIASEVNETIRKDKEG